MNFTREQVREALEVVAEEREMLHLLNNAALQADSEYMENCNKQKFVEIPEEWAKKLQKMFEHPAYGV